MDTEQNEPTIEKVLKQAELFRFIDWLAQPDALREPKTQTELAKELNVEDATLSDWKKLKGFWDRVNERIDYWAISKNADVVQALYNKIMKNPKAPDFQIWLTAFKGYKDTTKVEVDDKREATQKLDAILSKIMGKPNDTTTGETTT